MSDPWYRDGLRFECSSCGACCEGPAGGPVWANAQERKSLAARLGVSADRFLLLYARRVGRRWSLAERGDGSCAFYDRLSKRCSVYEDRPRQCRTFPFWRSCVANAEAWGEAGGRCEGIGRGELIGADEITARVRVVRM